LTIHHCNWKKRVFSGKKARFFHKKTKNSISTEKKRFFAEDFRLFSGCDALRVEAFQIVN
jgi:hypothetical protein